MSDSFSKLRDGIASIFAPAEVKESDSAAKLDVEKAQNRALLAKMMDYARHLYLSRGLTGYIFLSIQVTVFTEGITLYVLDEDLVKYKAEQKDNEIEPGLKEQAPPLQEYTVIDRCIELLAKAAVPYKDCDYDVQVYTSLDVSVIALGITATMEVSAKKMNDWTAKLAEEAKLAKEASQQKTLSLSRNTKEELQCFSSYLRFSD